MISVNFANKIKAHFLLMMIVATIVVSCKSDKPESQLQPIVNLNSAHGIYVVNEGNFQFGNAAVSYYNAQDSSVVEDIFKTSNNASLGDVCQSMSMLNGWYYLVVNNSQKIEVVNPLDFKRVATIGGFTSPRYILQVSNSKAYVSDFKSHRVSIMNLNNHSKQGEIPIHGWTEEMLLLYGKAFITNMDNDKLYIVNTATDVLEDSLTLAQCPGSLVEDKNGKLWVLCQGDASIHKPGALFCINPINKAIEKRIDFALNEAPQRLCINDSFDTLYFINKHIYQMPVDANNLPTHALINGDQRNFYGLSIEPKTGNIYAADAIDYIQKGKVYSFNSKGTQLLEFKVGLIPSKIYFK
jgi:hypothetical protein